MGLIGDINEIKKEWKKSSLGIKIIIVLSSFFVFSSITSLSDVIFSWKGFILDGIEFYKSIITHPLKKLLEKINLFYQKPFIDYIIICIILYSSLGRWLWHNSRTRKSKDVLYHFFMITMLVIPIIIPLIIFNNSSSQPKFLIML